MGKQNVPDLHPNQPRAGSRLRRAAPALLLAALILGGCTARQTGTPFNDPYETTNRQVHEFNRGIDRAVLRPGSRVYGSVLPRPVRTGVVNFARNLNTPGDVVNNLLQGDVENAVPNTFRFLINSTVGIAGLFDPATSIGLPGRRTNFGQTLYVWGVPEGTYLELPLFGPSTQRAAVGGVVDVIIDPLRIVLPNPEAYVSTAATVASSFGYRYDYSAVIDGILYESADSYAQSRLLYLQNQRYQVGDTAEDENFDPYEDPYAP